MKIICNKAEFAQLVRNCYRANGACGTCLLHDICNGEDSVVAMADVEEEREPHKSHICINCKWWRTDIKGATCGKYTGLAVVTTYTTCSYWEAKAAKEPERAGDTK